MKYLSKTFTKNLFDACTGANSKTVKIFLIVGLLLFPGLKLMAQSNCEVLVIGSTGLMLWVPEFFTKFLPGWLINVTQIIHSDEALPAVGFIFTIHFFNTHLRPESFPMATVIFTGYVLEEEYKKDRPHEYEQLVNSGKINDVRVEKEFTKEQMKTIRIFGFTALFAGVIMIILIIYSLIFH